MTQPYGPGPLYAWESHTPRIAQTAWIAPTAVVAGDVEIGEFSSIWFHCTLRGDISPIRIGARSNVQDGSILHISGSTMPCLIGDDVTIGHGAIVHAATIKNHAFVGMGATVLDGAVIEERGMLAAGGLLTPGKIIGPGELWGGAPARRMRVMSPEDLERYAQNAAHYVALAQRFKKGLRSVE
jgi:carbonic anhydrase/acetyltransferase-like protein (isoleucine patch superfamily)